MMKKLTAVFSALAMIAALIPVAFAAPADYIGSYYTPNTDGTGYAAMDILTCTDTSITVRFKRIKNDMESYTYTFDEGTVFGDTAVIPFHAVTTANGAAFDGKMTLTFGGLIKVQLISNLGSEMYTGSLPRVSSSYFSEDSSAPQTSPEEIAPAVTAPANGDITVSVNGSELWFEEGQKPYIDSATDRTFIPLRALLTAMGVNVYWDEYRKNTILNEQLITCTKNNTILQFARTFNQTGYNAWSLKEWVDEFTSSDNYVSLDISQLQPVIGGDKSFVPLRVLSEAFNADVSWDENTRSVSVVCGTDNSYWYDTETIGKIEDFTNADAKAYITDEYTSVVPDSTPYFAPSSKFYLFDAIDTFGTVTLRIYYGGYIDALPKAAEAQPMTEADAETATEAEESEITNETDEAATVGADAKTEETETADGEE